MLKQKYTKGFTLVEMLVAVALFIVVMVVALGALLTMSHADRKAQSLKVAINNLNASLDAMSRNARTGKTYHCGTSGTITNPQDCSTTGGTYLALVESDGVHITAYCYDAVAKQVKRQRGTNGLGGTPVALPGTDCTNSSFLPITSSEMKIDNLSFYVAGTTVGDDLQPRVTILMSGAVPTSVGVATAFNLQTSVTQRLYDQ